MTVINASCGRNRVLKKIQALSGIRTHDLFDASAVQSGLCSSSGAVAALALMTVITQLLLMSKITLTFLNLKYY